MGWNRKFKPQSNGKVTGADRESFASSAWNSIPYDLKRKVLQTWLKSLYLDMTTREYGFLDPEPIPRGKRMAVGRVVVDLVEHYNALRKSGIPQRVSPDELEMNLLARLQAADAESASEIVELVYERNRRNLEEETRRVSGAPRNQSLDEDAVS